MGLSFAELTGMVDDLTKLKVLHYSFIINYSTRNHVKIHHANILLWYYVRESYAHHTDITTMSKRTEVLYDIQMNLIKSFNVKDHN
jgi:hypothetical protein